MTHGVLVCAVCVVKHCRRHSVLHCIASLEKRAEPDSDWLSGTKTSVEMYQSNERTSFAVLTHSLLPTQSRASALHLATKGSISELAFDGKMSWAAKNSKSPSCPLGGELQCVCVRVAGYRFGIYTVFLSHTDTMPVPWL